MAEHASSNFGIDNAGRQGRAVTVLIDDDGLTTLSGKNSNRVEWSKISKISDSQGFLILDCGKLTVACLPKWFLDEEQIDFVKSRLTSKK